MRSSVITRTALICSVLLIAMLLLGAGSCPATEQTTRPLKDVVVLPSTSEPSATATYSISFEITPLDFFSLPGGSFQVRFPVGFGLASAQGEKVQDNHPTIDFLITETSILDGQVTLRIVPEGIGLGGPGDSIYTGGGAIAMGVEISSIENPATEGTYEIAIEARDRTDRTLAGPSGSAPFAVSIQTTVHFVGGQFSPDTVYPDFINALSATFLVDSTGLAVDSARLRIAVVDQLSQGEVAIFVDTLLSPVTVTADTISHAGIGVRPVDWGMVTPGDYDLGVHYVLFSGSDSSLLDTTVALPLTVLPEVRTEYVTGSLAPILVPPGISTAITLEVNALHGYSLPVHVAQSLLILDGLYFDDTVALSLSSPTLDPGANAIASASVTIPDTVLADTLDVALVLILIDPYDSTNTIALTIAASEPVIVEEPVVPSVQIKSLAAQSPNAPRVNIGQAFTLAGVVENPSKATIGPLSFRLTSDGASQFTEDVIIASIPPQSTVDLAMPVTASKQVSSGEIFRLELLSTDIEELPPDDDVAFVIIERPALMQFTYEVFGAPTGVVGYGQQFNVSLSLTNLGDAAASEATYVLTSGGVDFGAPDTLGGSILEDQVLSFAFRAPALDTQATFMAELLSIPLDLNTGLPAPIDTTRFAFNIRVTAPGGDLVAGASALGNAVVYPDQENDLFQLRFKNVVTISTARVRLQSVVLEFDAGGDLEEVPAEFVDWSRSGLYRDGVLISTATPSHNRVILSIGNLSLVPQDSALLTLRLHLHANAPSSFRLRLPLSDVTALLVESPSISRRAQVVAEDGSAQLIDRSYTLSSNNFERSFIVSDNPFNPEDGPLELAYVLDSPVGITFRIYTLSGELVFERVFAAGSDGADVGGQIITWDGRNADGDAVRNGVYVAIIKNNNTGMQARVKIAVLR